MTQKRQKNRGSGKILTARSIEETEQDDNGLPAPYAGAHPPVPHDLADFLESYPLDRFIHAAAGRITAGISPISLGLAYFDWATHLALYPGKQLELAREYGRHALLCSLYLSDCALCEECEIPKPLVEAEKHDHRFDNIEWDMFPYNFYHQVFLLRQSWWDRATKNIRGVSRHHEDIVHFTTRQILDMYSPSNFPWTNPQIIEKTEEEKGRNFLAGFCNYMEDLGCFFNGRPRAGSDKFRPGYEVAVTPGKVVFRNHLIELIQYSPQTEKVYAAPVFFVPAWIMKYYILDLSPHNSLVRYLVEKGHTVFMISWKNPDSGDRDLSFEDYLNLGVMAALDAIGEICPAQKIHATGYCLGGTLLMMAASLLARRGDERLESVTLFAAQVDFEEGGELSLFMDESQLAYLEDQMWLHGYLDGRQMAGAFNMLRSNDLIWSRMIHDYMIGERRPINDLMAWNSDVTRMPFRMHAEYLRSLYLNNELSEGHFQINNETITLTDIRQPIFAIGTERDHISPWPSVYKIHLYTDTEVTFLLTSGGHNAGIVSEPGHRGRAYRIAKQEKDGIYVPPARWRHTTQSHEGSWWPVWQEWLVRRCPEQTNPPVTSGGKYKALCAAPGTYVLQK